mmetsp:Transcript_33112/g.63609  ORF Transcript_33112/g.63609 Transcript_33112/m.63609 type:complete len:81 (-) Transcript_33112:784-1026(-)
MDNVRTSYVLLAVMKEVLYHRVSGCKFEGSCLKVTPYSWSKICEIIVLKKAFSNHAIRLCSLFEPILLLPLFVIIFESTR